MEGKSNLTIEFVRDVITPIIMNRFCSKFGNCEIDEITTDSTWRTSWTSEAKKNKIRIVLYVPARGRTCTYMCTSHVRIDLRDEEFDLPSGVQTRPVCHVWVRSNNSRWDQLLTVGPQIGNGQFLSIGDMAENKYTAGLAENEIFGRDNLLDIARTVCEKINHAIERDLEVHARETAVTIPKLLSDTKLGDEEKQMEIRLGNVAIRFVKYTDFTHRYAVFEIGRVAKGELEALEKAYSHLSHQGFSIAGDPTNGTLQQKNVMGSLYTAVRLCLFVAVNICARNDLIEKENDTSEVIITYTTTNIRPTLIRIEHSSLAWNSPSWFMRFPVDWDAKEKAEDTSPKLLLESDAKRETEYPIITLHFLHHVVAPCIVAELKKHFEEARIIKREDCSVLEGKLMRLPDGPNISSRYSVLIGVIDGRPDRTMRYVKLEYWRNCDLVDHSIIGDEHFIRVYATNNQFELVEIMHIGRRTSSDPSQCKAVATAAGENFTFWNVPAKLMIENIIALINYSIDHKLTMLMFPGENKTLTELGAVPFGLVACTMKNLFEDYAHPSKHYQRQCYKRDQEIIYYDDEQTFEKDPICPIHFGATKLPSGQINVWFIDPSYVGILVQEFHNHKNTDDDGPWAQVLNFWVPDIPEQFCNWKMREKINGLIHEICARINLVCSGYTVHDTPEQKFWSYFKGFNVKDHVDDLNTDVIKSANTMLASKQDKQTNEETEDSDKLVITDGKPMIDVKQWETDEEYKYFNYIRGHFNTAIHHFCIGGQVKQIANSIDEVMWDCEYQKGLRTPKQIHAHIYLTHRKDCRDFNGIADDEMMFYKMTDDGKEEKVPRNEIEDVFESEIYRKVSAIYDQVRHMIEEDAERKPNIHVPFSVVACVLEHMLETYEEGYRRVCYNKTRFDCKVKIGDREYTIGAVKDKFKIIHVFVNDPTEGVFFDVINHMSRRSIYGSTGSPWTISRIVGMFPYPEPLQNTMKSLSAAINEVCVALTCTDTHDTYFSAYYADDVKPKIDDLSYDILKESARIYQEHLKNIVEDFQTKYLGMPTKPNTSVLTVTEGKPSTAGRLRPNPEFLWRGMQVLTDKSPLMADTERRGLKDLAVKKVSFEEWVEMTAKPVYTKMKRHIVEKTIDVNNIDLNTPGLVSSDDWGRLIHAFHDAKFTVDTEEIKQILKDLKEEKEMPEKKNVAVYEPEVRVHWNRDTEYLLFNYVRIEMNKLIMSWHRTRSVQWKGADRVESANCASWETKTEPVYRVELVHQKDDDIMSFYEVDPKTGVKTQITRNAESFDKRFGRGFYDAVDEIYKAVSHRKTELQTTGEPKYPHFSTDKNGTRLVTMPLDVYNIHANAQYGMSLAETDAKGMIQDAFWNPKSGTATIIWVDGTQTVSNPMDGTDIDPEIGFAICIAKKLFKTQNQWRKWFSKVVKKGEASASKKKDKRLGKMTKQAWARLAAEGITEPNQDQVASMIDKIDAENKAASKAAKAGPATVPAKKVTTPKKKKGK